MSKMLASGVRPPSDDEAIDRLWFCSGSGGSVGHQARSSTRGSLCWRTPACPSTAAVQCVQACSAQQSSAATSCGRATADGSKVTDHSTTAGALTAGSSSLIKSWSTQWRRGQITDDGGRTGSDAMRVLSSRTGSREGARWVRLWAELCGLPCSGWRSSPAQGSGPEGLRSAMFARVRDSFHANSLIGCVYCTNAGCTL